MLLWHFAIVWCKQKRRKQKTFLELHLLQDLDGCLQFAQTDWFIWKTWNWFASNKMVIWRLVARSDMLCWHNLVNPPTFLEEDLFYENCGLLLLDYQIKNSSLAFYILMRKGGVKTQWHSNIYADLHFHWKRIQCTVACSFHLSAKNYSRKTMEWICSRTNR